jgi:hypothetical protein
MIEAVVEDHLDKQVKRLGGETRKVIWVGRRGAPDRRVFLPRGRGAWVETKRPKKGAEAHQLREHARLRKYGEEVVVLDTPQAIDDWLRAKGFVV